MSLKKLVLAVALLAALGATPALAQMKVGVVSSSTGATALIGIGQRNSVPLLPAKIEGLDIQYIALDDASDPNLSVTNFKKLISEEKVDALIGPSGTPNAMAVLQFAAESGTPMLAPVGSSAPVLPMDDKKKWVFKTTQNTDIIAKALVDHMVSTGVKTVGFIGMNDAYGEDWLKEFSALAQAKGLNLTIVERYGRADNSVTGQTLKIFAAKPDAVLVAGTGGAAVLPQSTLVKQGYKGVIYQTHGAALDAFLKLGGKEVEGTVLAASLMLVLDQMPDSHPSKKVALDYIQRYEKLHNEKPTTFGANVYDAGLLLEQAVPAVLKAGHKPGTPQFRAALRDALEQTKELVATQGVYNMTPQDHSGFDERGRELITVKNGKWTLIK